MIIGKYTLKNWHKLIEKDWEYLKQDNGTANIENIISHLITLAEIRRNR